MKNRTFQVVIVMVTLAMTQWVYAGTIKGKVTAHGAKNAADAVIYIDKIAGKTFSAPKTHAKIDQRNMTFKPRVLPILAGTTVDFLNSDDVLHNVYSPDKCCGKFNLGSWPKGQTKSYTFSEAGCFATLLCNVHPEMQGNVIVLETPYFAVSTADGSFEIKNIPAGTYALKIWHEKLHGAAQQITVSESGEVDANFDIKR
jgi:plastocyanin